MVAVLFRIRNIAAVVVGADRVAGNGDTANKIGTYQIAVAAKYHGVPFYVAAPLTSIDLAIPSGDRIVIEERPDREMTHVGEHRIAAPGEFLVFCDMLTYFNKNISTQVSHVGIQHLTLLQLVLSKVSLPRKASSNPKNSVVKFRKYSNKMATHNTKLSQDNTTKNSNASKIQDNIVDYYNFFAIKL